MESNLLYNYFAATHQGLVRTNNEDAHGDIKTNFGHAYIVCDGMGGHAAGEKASQIAVETIANFLKNCEDENHQENLKNAIIQANNAILEEVDKEPSLKGMGTTCVVLYLFKNGQILLGHVGDSRIYEYYNKTLKRVTKDHSYVQFLVDTGEITPEEAETHKSKNQILRALGADDTVKPEVSDFINPNSKTCYILCSDGLNDMVNDKAIEAILNKYNTISLETVEHLVSEALNAGGKDNVTVGLLEILKNENQTAPVYSEQSTNIVSKAPQNNFKKFFFIGAVALFFIGAILLFLNKGEGEKPSSEKQEERKEASQIENKSNFKNIENSESEENNLDSIILEVDSL